MNDLMRMTIVLTVICLAAAAALAQVYKVTKEPIAAAVAEEARRAAAQVLTPIMADDVALTKLDNPPAGEGGEIFTARRGEKVLGFAMQVKGKGGYGGDILGMLGVDAEGNVLGYRAVQHAETPGLGAKISTSEPWLKQLTTLPDGKPRNRSNTRWQVKKDGGDIDAITGATITPRAVVASIADGLAWYERVREQLLAAAATPAPATGAGE